MNLDKNKLSIAMTRMCVNFSMLSKTSGISRATLSAINNGKSCNAITASKLAKALNVDITELLSNQED